MKTTTLPKTAFTAIHTTTSGGKKCIAILTDKRLNVDDFKALMRDIQTAEGYGFVKYFPEHKTRLITATGIDEKLLLELAGQYEWNIAEPKTKKPAKGAKVKTPTKAINTQTDIPTMTPELIASFRAFLESQSKKA